jgi:hypothetical protein
VSSGSSLFEEDAESLLIIHLQSAYYPSGPVFFGKAGNWPVVPLNGLALMARE